MDGTFGDWLVHAAAKRALVVEPGHFVPLDAKAGLTRVGFAKRTRNLKQGLCHALNVSPATVLRLHPVKTAGFYPARLFSGSSTVILAAKNFPCTSVMKKPVPSLSG